MKNKQREICWWDLGRSYASGVGLCYDNSGGVGLCYDNSGGVGLCYDNSGGVLSGVIEW